MRERLTFAAYLYIIAALFAFMDGPDGQARSRIRRIAAIWRKEAAWLSM